MAITKLQMYIDVITGQGDGTSAIGRKGGWSEGWYDDTEPSTQQIGQFRALCSARAAMLPPSAAVVAQRYQQIDPMGPSSVDLRKFPGTSKTTDFPALSLFCRVRGNGVRQRRPTWIRCIPDEFITAGEYTPDRGFKTAVDRFQVQLQGWNFKCQALGEQTVPIMNIDANGVFTLAEDLDDLVDRTRVAINRTTQTATKNQKGGKFWVRVNDEGVHTLVGWTLGACSGGTMRLVINQYPEIPAGALTTGRIATKKIGRPFERFVGRRSKRR